jgi:hypothetical protein
MVVKTLSAREQELLDAALDYAGRGIPVFPCEANGKRPLIKHDARPWGQTTDLDEVRAYWGDIYAGCNIGIPTGEPSRVFVLDVDKKGGAEGHVTLATLIAQHGPLPDTIEAATPSGGNHYLFQHIPGIRNTAGKLGNGLDTRGDGGYIVAVPSSIDGKRYRWTCPPGLFVVAKAPQWLVDLLLREDKPAPPPQDYTPRKAPDAYVQRALDEEYAAVRGASPGTRNDQLNTSAFKLFTMVENYGLDAHVVEQAMTEAALACGLQHHEIKSTLMSARRGGLQKSRPPLPAQEVRPAHNPFQVAAPVVETVEHDPETGEIREDAPDIDGVFFDGEEDSPPSWLVKGILHNDGVCFVGGQSGAGKTFMVVDLAVAIASGNDFFGHMVKERVGVAILAAEGAGTLKMRIKVARLNRGVTMPLPIATIKDVPMLMDAATHPAIAARLKAIDTAFRSRFGVRLGVVIIDTVAAAFGMEDEDSNSEAAKAIRIMNDMSAGLGVVVVPVHHYGKTQETGLRGASAWRAGADTVLSLIVERSEIEGTVTRRALALAKSRVVEEGPISDFDLEFKKLGEDEDGDDIGACFVKPSEKEMAPKRAKLNDSEKVFRKAFNEAHATGSEQHVAGDATGARVWVVPIEAVRKEFFKWYTTGEADPTKRADATRKAFKRIVTGSGLAKLGLVSGVWAGTEWVWSKSK